MEATSLGTQPASLRCALTPAWRTPASLRSARCGTASVDSLPVNDEYAVFWRARVDCSEVASSLVSASEPAGGHALPIGP